MTCCDSAKNLRLYRAESSSGQAVYCVKCGRAHPASPQEAERILSEAGRDE